MCDDVCMSETDSVRTDMTDDSVSSSTCSGHYETDETDKDEAWHRNSSRSGSDAPLLEQMPPCKVDFEGIIKMAMEHECAPPFIDDPKGIPMYGEVIPREEHMWLKRMLRKANRMEYELSTDLMRDMCQIVHNCARFNTPESVYTHMAHALASHVERLILDDIRVQGGPDCAQVHEGRRPLTRALLHRC